MLKEQAFNAKEKRLLLTQGFSPDDIKQLEIQRDPVIWAETYLMDPEKPRQPLKLRSYQKKMISYQGPKKVYRCGRRIGKSVSLAIEALWLAFVTEGVRILICTPYKQQTANLWKDGFNKLIKGNPFLESSIAKTGQNPYLIEFKNGARILGLTAGSSTGNKGASIRGQNADILILDEVDYMGQEAIQTIQAIAATSKKTRIIISSTPTGKREYFYDACTNKNLGFEQFHFPSSHNPEWVSVEDARKRGLQLHESQEYLFRNTTSEYDYLHEYEAEFGEENQGVFKHKLLDSSLITYDPLNEELEVNGLRWFCGDTQVTENLYAMGVDWNGTKVGTQIVITEYCRVPTAIRHLVDNGSGQMCLQTTMVTKKYRTFYRESVSIENMTQLESISRIIELTKRFKIDHIYVDAGFGTTNIEELKLYGIKHPESGMTQKLVPIDFASNISIYDPYTKEEVKKSMKPFCVNNAVTCLERNELLLPDSEDEKIKLVGQMREYRIEKISPLGTPRYSEDNDHILDAFNLSLLAFQMEYSELIRLSYTNEIAISKKPSLIMPGLEAVQDRSGTTKPDKLQSMGIPKRQAALGADKYHSDSRGKHMDYEDLMKSTPATHSPFGNSPVIRTGWTKLNAPTRSNF